MLSKATASSSAGWWVGEVVAVRKALKKVVVWRVSTAPRLAWNGLLVREEAMVLPVLIKGGWLVLGTPGRRSAWQGFLAQEGFLVEEVGALKTDVEEEEEEKGWAEAKDGQQGRKEGGEVQLDKKEKKKEEVRERQEEGE